MKGEENKKGDSLQAEGESTIKTGRDEYEETEERETTRKRAKLSGGGASEVQ
jgi:hypothetical protein